MFARTNTVDGHYHVVKVDIGAGIGTTSPDNGHQHEVMLRGGGMGAPDGALIPADWDVLPGPNGHIHAVVEITDEDDKPKEKETYDTVLKLFQEEIENDEASLAEAKECEDFYFGKQWNEADKAKLDGEGRACLVLNRCESLVDSLSGTMRQNRVDWKCRPMEGGDQKTADLCTLALKAVALENQLDAEETDACEDKIIGGRSAYQIVPGYDEQGRKKVLVEWFPRDDFFCGPHLRRDLRDCEHMSKARWYSRQGLMQEFPEIDPAEIPERWIGPEANQEPGSPREDKYNFMRHPNDNLLFDVGTKRIRVVDMWRKELTKKAMVDGVNLTPTAARKAARIPGVTVEWVPVTRMRQTIFSFGRIIKDWYPPLPKAQTFPLFVDYAHKRRKRWWGKLQAAKDPQRDINKRESQLVDMLNRMAGYGWFVSRDLFETSDDFEKFKRDSSRSGWTANLQDVSRKPIREDGGKVPTEIIAGLEQAKAAFSEVTSWSNVWINGSGEMSGDSISERQRNALLPNEFLFDNLRQVKVRMGKAVLGWIQMMFEPADIARLVMTSSGWEKAKIDGQPAADFTEQDIIAMLQNKDLTKYDVIVSEENWSPTTRMANFRAWSKIPNVPLRALVEMSDIPNKEKMLEYLDQQEAAQAQAEQAKNNTEIQKTLIAKGVNPNAGQPPQ